MEMTTAEIVQTIRELLDMQAKLPQTEKQWHRFGIAIESLLLALERRSEGRAVGIGGGGGSRNSYGSCGYVRDGRGV